MATVSAASFTSCADRDIKTHTSNREEYLNEITRRGNYRHAFQGLSINLWDKKRKRVKRRSNKCMSTVSSVAGVYSSSFVLQYFVFVWQYVLYIKGLGCLRGRFTVFLRWPCGIGRMPKIEEMSIGCWNINILQVDINQFFGRIRININFSHL